MQNAESNPTPQQPREIAAKRPGETPAAGRAMPDASSREKARGANARKLTAEAIAGKTPTGLPPIDVDRYACDSGDPVRRAASRIVTLDNANMASTDNTVDVDGKGREAQTGASEWHDNVIYSNASLDEAVDTPDDGLAGIESRPHGYLPEVEPREGWRVVYGGTVDIERTTGARTEHVFSFERSS
ncbi:DUF3005 domain-containing protein [Burkholderia oklahomensis]|uniref:2-oxoglutarate dehydrogenase n=1 Tax=Burkholderia oklahomensis TaxID=342113 RepID=A0AAI8BB50_9BURK|nr:DUF3005 domain-containing protein [Burkholderia oklahomensis]AIO69052.1 hypothetical protein DM82_4087 [Burkholderia oklahomensis]AJX35070.1 hypothetical protein BG90_3939 [Burkholderia oklahomensis C6786]AOI40343.1 2-oxoglutarate dehydrogenase [Burkholderia oklahomensis EO147]AOI49968.1 2-oxoglutarate dehydrogenase [Burkholderia oklahomensis C6786]KUY53114.1 2-oxoglutarate dehydrogenase [Burkholderia oklahomensis C6786]